VSINERLSVCDLHDVRSFTDVPRYRMSTSQLSTELRSEVSRFLCLSKADHSICTTKGLTFVTACRP
jgi:hypothetical protein